VPRPLAVILAVLVLMISAVAQTARMSAKEQTAIVDFAKKAAVRSLNFQEGDVHSLADAQINFTPEAWREFMNHMNGFLDDDGAPTYTSSFVPSGKALIQSNKGQQDGTVHFRIAGTLTQTHDQSTTTYRHAALDIQAGGQPIKIQHLEQIYMAH
jgi:hypothetical protein